MTIIEQRAFESIAGNLPRIMKELKRGNHLKALYIKFRIQQALKGANMTETELAEWDRDVDSIMEGI